MGKFYKGNNKSGSILSGADPIFIEGKDVGFLFIHGFTATPYEGKELSEWLNNRTGITVSVPLLPGHGTRPADLKPISWIDWYNYIKEKYFELKRRCNRIFVCGQSMGGTLALHLAAHHPVEGIITLAAAVFLKDWRLKLFPLVRYVMPYHFKSKGPDIRKKSIKHLVPTYSRYPMRVIGQLLSLLKHTRQDLTDVTAPALLIHSRKDRTVHFSNLQYIYDRIASEKKELFILEESYHVISIDVEKEKVFQVVSDFINKLVDCK